MFGIRWACKRQLWNQWRLKCSLESPLSYIVTVWASPGLTSSDPRILTCPLTSNIHPFPTWLINPQVICFPWLQGKHFDLLNVKSVHQHCASLGLRNKGHQLGYNAEKIILTAFQLLAGDTQLRFFMSWPPHGKQSWASRKGLSGRHYASPGEHCSSHQPLPTRIPV